jgi:hypothetical protein
MMSSTRHDLSLLNSCRLLYVPSSRVAHTPFQRLCLGLARYNPWPPIAQVRCLSIENCERAYHLLKVLLQNLYTYPIPLRGRILRLLEVVSKSSLEAN